MKRMIDYIRFGIGQSLGRCLVNVVKLVVLLVVCLIVAVCCDTRASAATYSPDLGYATVGNSYVDYLVGLCRNDDYRSYVVYRSGQYTYTGLSGDLDYKDGTLTGEGVVYTIDTSYGYGSSARYYVDTRVDPAIVFTPGQSMIYSNVRGLGAVTDGEMQDTVVLSLLVCFVVFCGVIAILLLLRKC